MRVFFLFVLFLFSTITTAQIRYGFKTGLNFSRLEGPTLEDAAANTTETVSNLNGFHIGMSFSYKFSDNAGFRGEALFSKKGYKYIYEGATYRTFRYEGGQTATTGNAKLFLKVNNAFIDIPLMVYGRAGKFEFTGGLYGAVLVNSVGEGSLTYTNIQTAPPLNNNVADLEFYLDYNYLRDKAGEGNPSQKIAVKVDAKNLELPKTLGAYYDLPTVDGNLFRGLDYGLIGGINYFLGSSLYTGVRLQYGLTDLTNNRVDVQLTAPDADGNPVYQTDTDRMFTIQASVGFSF
jgi:hypothetical protein